MAAHAHVEFDEVLKMVYQVAPFVGLKDFLKDLPLRSVFLQRSYYAIMALNLVFCLCCITITIVDALQKGVFVDKYLQMADIIASCVGASIALCKSLNMFMKRMKIRALLDELREMWPKEDSDEETIKCVIETIKPLTKLLKWFSIVEMVVPILYIFISFALMSYNLAARGHTDLLFPFYEDYPFDARAFLWLSILCYVSQSIGGTWAGFNDPCTHGVMLALLTTITLQFKLLSLRLSRIGKSGYMPLDIDISLVSAEEERRIHTELENEIDIHKKILRLCHEFQNIFSTVLAVNFFLCSLLICQQIVTITMGSVHEAPSHIAFISSIFMQMLFICRFSAVLTEESYGISLGVYSSAWSRLSECHKRSLLLLQIRAHRPFRVRASVFFTTDLDTFKAIMKTAWSYFALLQTIYNK